MTLSTRNRFLIAAFVATIPAIGTLVVLFPEFAGAAAGALSAADHRAEGLFASLFALFARPSAWATVAAVPLACAYAAGTIVMLYYSFEKTQAPEILFFALFAFSFIGEFFRITVPIASLREWPPAIVVGAARALSFGRYFGVLALLASSVYANGIDFQKHGRVVIIIVITSLTIAAGVPVDGLSHDTALTPISGYRYMLDLTEITIAGIAAASFLVGAYVRSAREFYAAAGGVFLVTIGRDFLLRGDSWAAVLFGSAFLIGGTWLFAVKIHRYYLWL